MKSTIRVDFKGIDELTRGFEPCIRVSLEDSEDVRDGLLASFFQQLRGDSSWLVVDFYQDVIDEVFQPKRITITPVRPDELEETINTIKDRLPAKKDLTISAEDFILEKNKAKIELFDNEEEYRKKFICKSNLYDLPMVVELLKEYRNL